MIDARSSSFGAGKKLVMPINLSLRVTGLFYALYGGVAAVKLAQTAGSSHAPDATIFACAILVAFAVFGLALCLTVETLTFDPSTLSYRYRKGFGPFAKSIRGVAAEIRALSIHRIERTQCDGETTHTSASPVLSVRVEWNDARPSVELFHAPEEALIGTNRLKVVAKATRIAGTLGVPVEDRSV